MGRTYTEQPGPADTQGGCRLHLLWKVFVVSSVLLGLPGLDFMLSVDSTSGGQRHREKHERQR